MVEGSAGLVVFVHSADDVVTCMRVAARHDLPVVPRGSGTGLAGGATPIADAIVVVTAKMNRILEVRPEDRLAWVEPGVLNLDLGNALRPTGFTYAPDPSSQQVCSIGGNVTTNAGGPHCLAYGVTSAHVLAVDVVLPDGSVGRYGSEAPAAAGYDLRGYFVGSEGTLGIVTAACVRLTPHPPAVRTMLLDFADVEDCAQTVSAIIARGVVPAALEMMDRGIVRAVEDFVHAGLPDRCGRGPARRGRRSPGGRRGADARGRSRGPRARRRHDPDRRRRRRARAPVEGPQVGVRRDRADRAPLPPARLRRAAESARRGARWRLRDRAASRPDRHERLPRRRRQPPPAVLLRPLGAGDARTRPGGVRRARAALRRRGRVALR